MKKKIILLVFALPVSIGVIAQPVNNKYKQILSKGIPTYECISNAYATNYEIARVTDSGLVGFGDMKPAYSIQFSRDSLTYFIDFSGDSIKTGGNMPVSRSAQLFFEWVSKIMKTKVDILEEENKNLRMMIYIKAIENQK